MCAMTDPTPGAAFAAAWAERNDETSLFSLSALSVSPVANEFVAPNSVPIWATTSAGTATATPAAK